MLCWQLSAITYLFCNDNFKAMMAIIIIIIVFIYYFYYETIHSTVKQTFVVVFVVMLFFKYIKQEFITIVEFTLPNFDMLIHILIERCFLFSSVSFTILNSFLWSSLTTWF